MSDLIVMGVFVAGFCYLSNRDLKKREKIEQEAITRYNEAYKQ